MIYRARLLDPDVSPGIESAEVAMFTWDEIPLGRNRLSQCPLGARPLPRDHRPKRFRASPGRSDEALGRHPNFRCKLGVLAHSDKELS